jgi:hypothetical protein
MGNENVDINLQIVSTDEDYVLNELKDTLNTFLVINNTNSSGQASGCEFIDPSFKEMYTFIMPESAIHHNIKITAKKLCFFNHAEDMKELVGVIKVNQAIASSPGLNKSSKKLKKSKNTKK